MTEASRRPFVLAGLGVLCLVGLAVWNFGSSSSTEADQPERTTAGAASDLGVRKSMDRGEDGHGQPLGVGAGVVVDERSQPIAGIQVCANARRVARLSQLELRRRCCATTDEDGAFRIDELHPGEYAFGAAAKGRVPAQTTGWVSENPGEGVTLRLYSGGVPVRGKVLDLTGGEVAGAWVTAGTPAGTLSAADGSFEVYTKPGEAFVNAVADGYVAGAMFIVAPTDEVEILMAPESALVGRVVDADSAEPLAGVTVRANVETNVWAATVTGGWASTVTDDEGNFEFRGMSAGRFSVEVDDEEAYGRSEGTFGLKLGQTTGPVEIEARRREGTRFSGKLVDASDGTAVQGCQLELEPAVGGRDPHGWLETDGNGEFEGVFPRGEYRSSVNMLCPSHGMPSDQPLFVLGREERADLVFELEPASRIAGVVLDQHGKPFADVDVQARGGQRFTSNRAKADGSFEITGLPPDDYTVSVSSDQASGEADPKELTLSNGETAKDVDFTLERGAVINGRLVDQDGTPIEGAAVSAVGQTTRESKTLSTGAFSISGLSADSYNFSAKLEDGSELRRPDGTDTVLATVEVTASSGPDTVQLTAERTTGAITGVVMDEDGPVSDAYVVAEREIRGEGSRTGGMQVWDRRPQFTAQDGTFEIPRLPTGKFTLRAYRKDGTEAFAEHVETGADVTITIEPTSTASGMAQDGTGRALDDFVIRMFIEDGGAFRNEKFLQTEGEWSVDGLSPGSWTVMLMAQGRQAQMKLELAAGAVETGIVLKLEEGVEVSGRVVDADTGDGIPSIHVTVGIQNTKTDAEGNYTLSDVAPGKTSIWAGSTRLADATHMSGRLEVEVSTSGGALPSLWLVERKLAVGQNPGDLGITMQGGRTPSATVAAVRPNGPAANAGIAAGCEIQAINGRPIEGSGTLVRAYFHVPEGTALNITCTGDDTPRTVVAGPPR